MWYSSGTAVQGYVNRPSWDTTVNGYVNISTPGCRIWPFLKIWQCAQSAASFHHPRATPTRKYFGHHSNMVPIFKCPHRSLNFYHSKLWLVKVGILDVTKFQMSGIRIPTILTNLIVQGKFNGTFSSLLIQRVVAFHRFSYVELLRGGEKKIYSNWWPRKAHQS